MADPTEPRSQGEKRSTAALIVAAGRGLRLGADLPKQFLPLGDSPVLAHTIKAFLRADVIGMVTVVIHPDDRALYDAAVAGIDDSRLGLPATGGDSRASSVRLGLEAVENLRPDNVLIHDAARPFVDPKLIAEVTRRLDTETGAVAAIEVNDALWRSDSGNATEPVPRDGIWRAQTPQGFRFDAILAAHRANSTEAADDVAVARAAGIDVQIVRGSDDNFKITTQADLLRAQRIIAQLR